MPRQISWTAGVPGCFGLVGDRWKGAVAISARLSIPTDMGGPSSCDAGIGSLVVVNLAGGDFAKYHPELSVKLLTAGRAFRLEAAGCRAVVTT